MKIISELGTGAQPANGSGSDAHLASVIWTERSSFDAPACMQAETCAVRVASQQQKEDLSSKEVNPIGLLTIQEGNMVTTNGKKEPPNKHWFNTKSCLKTNLIKTPKT